MIAAATKLINALEESTFKAAMIERLTIIQ